MKPPLVRIGGMRSSIASRSRILHWYSAYADSEPGSFSSYSNSFRVTFAVFFGVSMVDGPDAPTFSASSASVSTPFSLSPPPPSPYKVEWAAKEA